MEFDLVRWRIGNWSPSYQTVWRNLEIDNKPHVVCFSRTADINETFKVILTDLKEIWIECLTEDIIFRKCETLNPLLKLRAFDWQQSVMDMLNAIPEHAVEVSVHQIKLQKDLDFMKLKYSLDLVKGTPREFRESVTIPLCVSSMEIVRQHEILLDLVKKKDEEIAEYKAGGAELIRKHIATKPFSEELFQTDTVPVATDFTKIFQPVFNCCNATILSNMPMKLDEVTRTDSSNDGFSDDDFPRRNRNGLVSLPKDKLVKEMRQNESYKDEERGENKCQVNPSTSGSSILKLSNTSHSIQKSLKKKKKTLSDLIS